MACGGQQATQGPTLASWTLPAWERGRSSEAWRTKKTRMRPAMRSTSAPAKLALGLLGLGLNLDRYSTLDTLPTCEPSQSTGCWAGYALVQQHSGACQALV